jgi:hypothetical protein
MYDNILYHTWSFRLDWSALGEIVKVLGSVATAGAAWFAATVAYRGLNKWRAETVGKRKAELAEDVLADFYQARDIITAARSPGSFGQEGSTRQKSDWEKEDDTRTLNAYFAPAERLIKKFDFFAQLHARQYRFMAYFGKEAAKPYDDLFALRAEILSAVNMLLATHQQRDLGSLPNDRRRWQDVIWAGRNETDRIPARLNQIVETIEATCRPAIQEVVR